MNILSIKETNSTQFLGRPNEIWEINNFFGERQAKSPHNFR